MNAEDFGVEGPAEPGDWRDIAGEHISTTRRNIFEAWVS